jgi:sec-independent protein translocase protein TatC
MVVIAAVLTPGPDVFSQLMLAVPMYALYELGILLVRNKSAKVPATVGA